jgi:hypothetical protein
VHLACQLIEGKLVRKNRPTQVSGFIVDLAGKCTEGLQINWVTYLVNQLEIDCKEAQDQGHEFHFSWLLILITFVAWELLEGATFLDLDPFEPLAVNVGSQFTFFYYLISCLHQCFANLNFRRNSQIKRHFYFLRYLHTYLRSCFHDCKRENLVFEVALKSSLNCRYHSCRYAHCIYILLIIIQLARPFDLYSFDIL